VHPRPTRNHTKAAQPGRPADWATGGGGVHQAKLSADQRRAQIASSGVTDPSSIVAQFGVSLRTAQNDIAAVRNAVLAQNGSTH